MKKKKHKSTDKINRPASKEKDMKRNSIHKKFDEAIKKDQLISE